jgi:quercetin dioxygenase-like cupin family protein
MQQRPKKPTNKGPAEWFTGDMWIDPITQGHPPSKLNIGAVHFTPGARTAWHSHDGGQTLCVTEGRGLVQSRRGQAIVRSGMSHAVADTPMSKANKE